MSGPVLILTGPPGAGKTTLAERLAQRAERAAHVEADRFFGFIRTGYVEPWLPESHAQNTAVMQIVAGAAAGYADAGYFTVVEGIVSPRWFYVPLRDALRAAGHAVAYAILRPPVDVCLTRRPAVEPAVVERLWRDFAATGELERNVIDNARFTPEATAELIERRLEADELLVA